MVTRTYRAAIRVGEDFITIEETVELPVDATDDQIAQAVNIGWRIYERQREAIEKQVALAREGRGQQPPTEASYTPSASDKQRAFISTLQDRLGWTSEEFGRFLEGHGVNVGSITRAQASMIIDLLQREVRQEGIIENFAKPIVTPGNKRQAVEDLL